MTEAQGLVPLDVDLYERVLDRNLGIVSERTEQRTKIPRRPATGISWDQLDSARRGDATGAEVYRAPDAATFLSDQFVKSHCFAAIRGYGPENGLTGLEFKPAKIGALPELTGVIWLDPRVNALRYLNFDYVNLPIPLRIARTTGRVDFQQLAGGQWFVPRWYIRMPRTARVTSTDVGSPRVVRDSLVGYQEVGGTARPAGTAPAAVAGNPAPSPNGANAAPATPAPAPAQSVLTGVVYDSTTGRPLKDVVVSTGVGRFKTRTSDGGRYELVIDGALSDKVIFDHPRLRLFHIPERVQTISVPPGSRGQAVVIVPSYGTLRKRLWLVLEELVDHLRVLPRASSSPSTQRVSNATTTSTTTPTKTLPGMVSGMSRRESTRLAGSRNFESRSASCDSTTAQTILSDSWWCAMSHGPASA